MKTIYDFNVKKVTGEELNLSEYKNKVLLIVNTASKCGFTPQYDELQKLYEKYAEKSFIVLAFPCNQFNNQEPAGNSEIQSFCKLNFGVTFPIFEKIDVNGENAHPLYNFLKNNAKGLFGSKKIKWNFTKFLIDKKGNVYKRYAPQTSPFKIEDDILELINK